MGVAYLDNAASTRPSADVLEVMAQLATQHFANPSSAHAPGAAAARELEKARQEVSVALGAAPGEVFFTAGGTEANALAVLGAAARARGRHLVATAIEHPAVLRNLERLAERDGFELTLVPVGPSGIVQPEAIAAAVRPDTAVVAVMLVNNEVGTLQPIAAIAQALSARARARAESAAGSGLDPRSRAQPRPQLPHLHVDAVQAFGYIAFRPSMLGADSLAISGHKLHGPKGTGALWLRAGARVGPLWNGGGQERGLRSGTENLPGIAGLARAVTLAVAARASGVIQRVGMLRDELETRIGAALPGTFRTVPVGPRAPHISSWSLPGLPAEPLLHALGAHGVIASAGSACSSKSGGPSHVLKAIGVDDDTAVLRFSLSRDTTAEDIRATVDGLIAAVAQLT
jgi:cysteine desulfurase